MDHYDLSVTKGSEDYGRGTFEFMDPVIIENWGSKRTIYNEFRDIYSLGVILYYLDQGTYPFEGSSRFGILNSIKTNYYKFTQGTDYDIIMIIESCLKLDEKKRKTLHEIIKMTEQALANLQNVKLKGALAISNIKNLPSWLIKFQNQPKESILDASQSVEFWLLGLIILLAAFIALNYFVWPSFSSKFRLMFTRTSAEQQGVETTMQHDETI